ncbi:MAG: DUF3108 domain-containing protein [Verrucomicrobiota bacterium]
MRINLLLRIAVFGIFLIPLSSLRAELPFSPGDRFGYDLHWSFIKVGNATLQFERSSIEPENKEYLHTILTVRTSGLADKIFKVRDKVESWVDLETGRPILYKKKQREGKTKRDEELHFNWVNMSATYYRNGKLRETIEISEDTYDPLSLILAIAETNFSNEDMRSFATTDGDDVVQIEVRHKKDRKIKTRTGHFQTHELDVATKELNGVFDKSPDASIVLWLSKEKPAIPVKMKSEVVVGSFHGELTEAIRAKKIQ